MKRIATFVTLFLLGCSSQPSSNIINVEIAPNQLTLEKRNIKMSQFEAELKVIVGARLKSGLKREDLTVNVLVDNKTTRGDIVDLETAMRHLNVRKIMYSSNNSEKQVLLRLE